MFFNATYPFLNVSERPKIRKSCF